MLKKQVFHSWDIWDGLEPNTKRAVPRDDCKQVTREKNIKNSEAYKKALRK